MGGNIKRMVVGAVSDIPAHNLPINPRVYPDNQAKSRGGGKPRLNTAEVAIQVSRQCYFDLLHHSLGSSVT